MPLKGINQKLKIIDYLIKKYERQKLGEGIENIKHIYQLMTSIIDCGHPFLVNSYIFLNKDDENFDKKITDVDKLVNMLYDLPDSSKLSCDLKNYFVKFSEKYGFFQRVSLHDLFNPVKGLGLPFKSTVSVSNFQKNDFIDFIFKKICECIKDDCKQFDISSYDSLSVQQSNRISFGSDVFFKEVTINNSNTWELKPNVGSIWPQNSSGRFKYKHKESKEENLVYIKCLVLNSQYADLDLKSEFFHNTILYNDFYAKSNLLSEIFVSIQQNENGEEFLFTNSKGQRLYFTNGSMLNFYKNDLYDEVTRFLFEASASSVKNIFLNITGIIGFKNFPWIPRINFKKCIVLPQQWCISKKYLIKRLINKMFTCI